MSLEAEGVAIEKRVQHEIVALQNAWRMVEAAVAKFREDDREKNGVGKTGIDFAAARDEVLGRIARLVGRA